MPRGAALDLDLRFDFDRKRKAVFFKFRKRVEKFGCEMVARGLGVRLGLLQGVNLQRRLGRHLQIAAIR